MKRRRILEFVLFLVVGIIIPPVALAQSQSPGTHTPAAGASATKRLDNRTSTTRGTVYQQGRVTRQTQRPSPNRTNPVSQNPASPSSPTSGKASPQENSRAGFTPSSKPDTDSRRHAAAPAQESTALSPTPAPAPAPARKPPFPNSLKELQDSASTPATPETGWK